MLSVGKDSYESSIKPFILVTFSDFYIKFLTIFQAFLQTIDLDFLYFSFIRNFSTEVYQNSKLQVLLKFFITQLKCFLLWSDIVQWIFLLKTYQLHNPLLIMDLYVLTSVQECNEFWVLMMMVGSEQNAPPQSSCLQILTHHVDFARYKNNFSVDLLKRQTNDEFYSRKHQT